MLIPQQPRLEGGLLRKKTWRGNFALSSSHFQKCQSNSDPGDLSQEGAQARDLDVIFGSFLNNGSRSSKGYHSLHLSCPNTQMHQPPPSHCPGLCICHGYTLAPLPGWCFQQDLGSGRPVHHKQTLITSLPP